MDGFCDALLEDGFSRSTVRRHLSNVNHLNAYIGARKNIDGQELCSQTVSDFLKDYPVRARNRGSLNTYVAGIKISVYRLVDYLHLLNRFEPHVKSAVYQPLLEMYPWPSNPVVRIDYEGLREGVSKARWLGRRHRLRYAEAVTADSADC